LDASYLWVWLATPSSLYDRRLFYAILHAFAYSILPSIAGGLAFSFIEFAFAIIICRAHYDKFSIKYLQMTSKAIMRIRSPSDTFEKRRVGGLQRWQIGRLFRMSCGSSTPDIWRNIPPMTDRQRRQSTP